MPEVTRLLCARHPHLGLVAALRRHPELRGEAVVAAAEPEPRLPVLAASEAAIDCGVRAGMPLRQAQQLCPTAVFVSVDGADVERLRTEVTAALGRHSPAVEVGDEESHCDLSGTHAAHRDEGRWATAIAHELMAVLGGTAPAVGVGSSRFVATMAARVSQPRHIRRVAPGAESAFLAPLPLHVLPVDPAITARLAAFGLDCLGAAANLSPADLQRQFGPEGLVVHRYIHGEGGAALAVVAGPRRASERVVLDGAVADLEVLRLAAHRCTTDLGARLLQRGVVATTVRLVLELEEAPEAAVRSMPPLPCGNPRELWTEVLALLGEVRPAAPVVAVRLEVELRAAAGRQADLWRGGDAAREQVLAAAMRLQRRYGTTSVRRPALALDPGDVPERRFTWAGLSDDPVAANRAAATPADGAPAFTAMEVRSTTQPAQKGREPWSRPPSRVPGRGHPRPVPASAEQVTHRGFTRMPA
ncbi:MAG: DNA polymerase Y family protein [Candidatus Dormibacteria bacterium]